MRKTGKNCDSAVLRTKKDVFSEFNSENFNKIWNCIPNFTIFVAKFITMIERFLSTETPVFRDFHL